MKPEDFIWKKKKTIQNNNITIKYIFTTYTFCFCYKLWTSSISQVVFKSHFKKCPHKLHNIHDIECDDQYLPQEVTNDLQYAKVEFDWSTNTALYNLKWTELQWNSCSFSTQTILHWAHDCQCAVHYTKHRVWVLITKWTGKCFSY